MSQVCTTTARSGQNGYIIRLRHEGFALPTVRLARVMRWDFTAEVDQVSWADSASNGALWALKSVERVTGSFDFNYRTDFPQHERIYQGKTYGLMLVVTSEGSPNFYHPPDFGSEYSFIPSALITQVSFSCDIATGELVKGHASFVSNGPLDMVHHAIDSTDFAAHQSAAALSMPLPVMLKKRQVSVILSNLNE